LQFRDRHIGELDRHLEELAGYGRSSSRRLVDEAGYLDSVPGYQPFCSELIVLDIARIVAVTER
jgi:hypothetical protein